MVTQQLDLTETSLHEIDWNVASIEESIRTLQEKNQWKKGQYFMMLRSMATGKKATPPLFETMQVIGKTAILERIHHAKSLIK